MGLLLYLLTGDKFLWNYCRLLNTGGQGMIHAASRGNWFVI